MAATPAPASSRDNVVGIVLIVGAVLIGVLLLAKGYDAEGGVVAATGDDSASATSSTLPADSTTTTTAAVASLPPAEVPVKVANGSGAPGVAGATRDTLLEKGYVNVAISDAPSLEAQSLVLYVEGSEGEARAVAEALGLDPALAQPVTDPPPVALDGAIVLVVAGPDLV